MAFRFASKQLVDLAHLHPPYTAEEEADITERYFHSDHDKWRELIVLHNMRFCLSFSTKFFGRTEDGDDIVMRAVGGMLEAADRFDPAKGYRFLTYCSWWMMSSLRDLLNPDSFVSSKTDLLTSALLDRPVENRRKDGDASGTVLDFIGHMASPDSSQIDPASQSVSDFCERDFDDMVGDMCRIMREVARREVHLTTEGQEMRFRHRMETTANVFRMKVGGSLYGDGLTRKEIAERTGLTESMVSWYCSDCRRLLDKAFSVGVDGTWEYLAYNDDIRRLFASVKSRESRPDRRQESMRSSLSKYGDWRSRCTRDKDRGTFVIGRSGGDSGSGDTVNCGNSSCPRKESPFHCKALRFDGGNFTTGGGRRKKLRISCRGIRYPAPTPWLEFPTLPESLHPERHVTKRTLKLPETCASCVHNPACSSWLGGCEFCENAAFRRRS